MARFPGLLHRSDNKTSPSLIVCVCVCVCVCGGGVAQSVECAIPGEEVLGSIPAVDHPLPTGWVGVSIM